jgi:RHS repeat-associated protein
MLTLYGAYGERLATYGFLGPFDTGGSMGIVYSMTLLRANVWFNGRNIAGNTTSGGFGGAPGDATFYQDRVGTDRSGGARYRPYGEEITSTSNDRVKFGTYIRDSATGMDYADQRYYTSAYGRFSTPDPLMGSATPRNPGSWNRYAYTAGDPINRTDPTGQIIAGCESGFCVGGYGSGYYWNSLNCQMNPDICVFITPIEFAQDPTTGWEPECSNNAVGSDGTQYNCLHHTGTDWNSFVSVLSDLGTALKADPECDSFFATGPGGAAAFNAVFAPGAANVNFQLADDIVPVPGFAGAISGAYNQVPGAPIVINEQRFGANTYSEYLTILHEVGHLLDPTDYNQADGVILPNGTSGGAGNNQLIIDNCSKTLGN